jgi:hypothetical protein
MSETNEKSAIVSEHQRLLRQLSRAKWEQGLAEGSHARLRKAVEGTLWLFKSMLGAGHSVEETLIAAERRLQEALMLDNRIKAQAEAKIEYPADHPVEGDLGSVPL